MRTNSKIKRWVSHWFHPRRSNNHRPKVLHPEIFLLLAVFLGSSLLLTKNLGGLSSSLDKILGFASNITVSQVVEQTNQQRLKNGLKPVTLNSALSQAALAKGQDMFSDQYWAHTAPDGTEPWYWMSEAGYEYVVAGENLARDFSETPEMVSAWMASPTHKANIVNSKYREVGVAVIDGVLEGYETTVVIQLFGTPRNGVTASISQSAPTTQRYAFLPNKAQALEDVQTVEQEPMPQAASANEVLASALVPLGQIKNSPLLSPLQVSKALVLIVLVVIVMTLIYDMFVIGHRRTMRLVGKNLAHIILLGVIIFLVIFFKGGMIG